MRLITITLFGLAAFVYHANAAVLTSIKPLAFIVSAVADGVTSTEVLLPDGASPHQYALKPSEVQRLMQADLVLWIGPEFERFLEKPLRRIPATRQLALSSISAISGNLLHAAHSNGLEAANSNHHDHGHDAVTADWHIWLSPSIAREIAQAVSARLAIKFPEQQPRLAQNLAIFLQQLDQHVARIRTQLAPLASRRYVVFHDGYRYFEQAFGLQQSGYFLQNPDIAPGVQRVLQLRQAFQKERIDCVFTEPQFTPAIVYAVVDGTNTRIGQLDPLGGSIAVTPKSYFELLSDLAEQFTQCLRGT